MRRLFVILATLSVLPLAAQNEDDARQFQKLAQVFRYLSGLYVDEVEMKPVVEGAITGMLEELDPHSAYIGAEEMKGVQESFDGEFSGIGVEFNGDRGEHHRRGTSRTGRRQGQRPHRAH